MRNVFAAALILLAGSLVHAFAVEQSAPVEQADPAPKGSARLDKLFADLKRERNEKAAERIAGQIWEEWFKSGSASIDLMMMWAQNAMNEQKYDVALDFLDEVITLSPSYAEGWNRRATLHFMMSNYGKSMSDIDHTLSLEPRHFGAISGLGMIMQEFGDEKRALDAFRRAVAIHPHLLKLPDLIKSLSEKVEGRDI